jgi:hypothetical protein
VSVLPPRVIVAGVVTVLALEVGIIAPQFASLVVVAAGIWMALPGIALGRAVFSKDHSGIAALLVGPALALGFSVLGAFLWWAIGVQNWVALLLGPALTWSIALLMRRFGGPTLAMPSFDRRDVVAVAFALLIVPAVTWAPYDHVREPVPDGEAYRAYFTADFIWAMTVTAEIAKGDVPPHNPFLRDEPLHYYWLAHFLSGAVYRNVAPLGIRLETVVLLNGLLFGVAFVAFMYALARFVGAGPAASSIAVAVGFVANSYEGADMIRAIVQHGQPWGELANTNIDAVTRWFYQGMAVDGLQRLLLYQPHHLTGYALALAAVWLVGFGEDVSEVSVALGAGVLLAMALLFSTFGALIVGFAVGLVYAVRLLQQRRSVASAAQCAVLGGMPVAVGVALTSALGYTDDRYGMLLHVGLNPVALRSAGRVWFLSFGPLLLGAAASLGRLGWLLRQGAAPLALVSAATAFYFFTNVPDTGDVWVGWRSGHLLLVAFAVMCAALWTALWRTQLRAATVVVTAVGVALALPTVAIDVYNAQDVTNRSQGATFPWTMVITPEERAALEWVRTSTPPGAVVQVEPYSRGAGHWSYIGAFAERRTIAGLPGSMIPMHPYKHASDDLWEGVFHVGTAQESHAMARFLGVDYLFIGAVERHQFRDVVDRLAAAPDLFPVAFKNKAVTIFAVAPIGPGPPPRHMMTPVKR